MKVFRFKKDGEEGFDILLGGMVVAELRALECRQLSKVCVGVRARPEYDLRAVRAGQRREQLTPSLVGVWKVHNLSDLFFVVERWMQTAQCWMGAVWIERQTSRWEPIAFDKDGVPFDETGRVEEYNLANAVRITNTIDLPIGCVVPVWLLDVKG